MLPTTPSCDKTQKQANKIAGLSMMLYTNPYLFHPEGHESVPHLEYQGLLMGCWVPFDLYLQGASVLSVQGVVCISCTI